MRIDELEKEKIDIWNKKKNFLNDQQAEKDLLIENTAVAFYTDEYLKENFAFKGGTALYKCYLQNNLRFSEDIDLNQCFNFKLDESKERIKKAFENIGFPLKKHFRDTPYGIQLTGHYNSKITEKKGMLKIDINCNEHFSIFGFKTKKNTHSKSLYR